VSFLGVSEKYFTKYCSNGRNCFWGYAALIEPVASRDLYIFDCSLFNYARDEYREYPELRVLLSFKTSTHPSDIWFTNQLGYVKLPEITPCNNSDIETCLNNSLKTLESMIEEASSQVKLFSKREALRFILPKPPDYATARGRYHGLLIRKSILSEIASNLGFNNGVLNSRVRSVYVLYSVDYSKWDFTALICDKHTKLNAHKKIIDKNKLLSALRESLR